MDITLKTENRAISLPWRQVARGFKQHEKWTMESTKKRLLICYKAIKFPQNYVCTKTNRKIVKYLIIMSIFLSVCIWMAQTLLWRNRIIIANAEGAGWLLVWPSPHGLWKFLSGMRGMSELPFLRKSGHKPGSSQNEPWSLRSLGEQFVPVSAEPPSYIVSLTGSFLLHISISVEILMIFLFHSISSKHH